MYLIIILCSSSFIFISTVHSNPTDSWWNPDWDYRKEITIDHTKVVETLAEFPLLVNIIDTNFTNHMQPNGNDIVFTTKTGIQLNHEIESYNSSSGKLVAWVNLTSLSNTQDTTIYLYYGNPTCGNQQNPAGTWNHYFATVNHLKEPWSRQTGNFKDSTSNHHDGTLTDANANSMSDAGIAGNGFRFSGDADKIIIGAISQPKPITYSCWLKADTVALNGSALGRYGAYYLGTWNTGGGRLRESIYINNVTQAKTFYPVSSNQWYLLTVTYDGTIIRYYVNGTEKSTKIVAGNLSALTSKWHIGDNGNNAKYFKGVVDEIQIASTCLSAGWITTHYHNVNSPATFYTIGAEETRNLYTLTLTTSGTGTGTIQATPAGPYNYGTVVTITATATTGSTFAGFSGDLTGTTTPQTLTIDGDKAVNAEFTLNGPYQLVLTISGTGKGLITASPDGPYFYGTTVTIDATPAIGSTFSGFTGSLTGSTTPQTLTMNGDKSVDAAFTLKGPYTLTLTTSGTGTGTIQASPPGPYYYGAIVTIWANASLGSAFTGYTGNLTGITTPQTLTIDGNKIVYATFMLYTPGPNNWWNTTWLYRKQIHVDHSKVTGILTNFPILVDIVSGEFIGHVQSDADDFVFVSETGVKLSHEIETYNVTTGHLIAWVNVPSLSSTVNTLIYLYYGNPLATNQQNVQGTWNSGFKAVYHLKESWSTSAGHFKDSTSNHYNGTLTDTNGNSASDTGIAGPGFRFNGDADFINIGIINHPQPITYSCWLKANNVADARDALGRYYHCYCLGTWPWGSGVVRQNIYVNNNLYYSSKSGVSSNVWYLLTVTYDGNTIRYYTNGVQDTSTPVIGNLSWTTSPWHIGDSGNAEYFFKGVVDEVRIANTCLSGGWIATYYRNVNSPSTFYAVDGQETQSGLPPVISNEHPANGASNTGFNPQLQADVSDPDNNMISCELWTNASGTWQLLNRTIFYTGSGTISSTPTDMINPLMKYWWRVKSTDDGINWVSQTYRFTTGKETPLILEALPQNNIITNINPRLSVKVLDYQDDLLTVTFRQKVAGTWETLGTYSGHSGLFTQNTVNMDVSNQTYYWSYNVTDGKNHWVNLTSNFKVQPFVLKWTNGNAPINTVGPVAVDVNNDSVYEIFQVGIGKVICVNGSTGNTIWTYYDNQIAGHSIPAVADLNHDGIPELVIACDESKAGIIGKTLALHANDGSVYWRVDVPTDHRHLVIADIDGTGYPYVYVVAHVEHGWISKLRGTDGTVLAQTRVYYPCHGGLSIADLDNDGTFELILADYYREPGKGIHCYDAETLKLKWYIRNRGDPQIGILADVNKDGILDVTTSKYSSGPVQVINGATVSNMDGYSELTSPTHSPLTIYDIDGDGNLETLVCLNSTVKVFDLYTKSLDAILPTVCDEPPFMADVIGDNKLEIIAAYYNKITIYNSTYQNIGTISGGAERWTLVQDIDNDGQNELVVDEGGAGQLRAYETSAYTPTPQVRTGTYGYSEKCTGAGVYIPPPGAPQPILKQEAPKNGSLDVSLNPTLSVHAIEYQVHELIHNHIVDYQYDKMNITISTNVSGTWQTLTSFSNTGNGCYNYTVTTMNNPDTTYYWKVTATDINPQAGGITTTKIYHFTTKSAPDIGTASISPPTPYQSQNVTFSAAITDDVHVKEANVRITGPVGFTPKNTSLYTYQWTRLTYDDFESGWGNYTSGGADCSRYQKKTVTSNMTTWPLIPQGNWAANIQANSGNASSFALTNPIDILTPGYTAIKIDFWMNAYGMDDGKTYVLEYYDGTQWITRKTYTQNNGSFDPGVYTDTTYKFANWINFHDTVWINKSTYTFPINMNIRFRCTAADANDDVFIDQIFINATRVEPVLYTTIDTFTIPGQYNYSIWCTDVNGNTNSSVTRQFTVLSDSVPPQITDVLITPPTAIQGALVNITCNVQDNKPLQDIRINITNPNATIVNTSITSHKINSYTYYSTQNYSTIGTYHFYLWAIDSANRTMKSQTSSFEITQPPQNTPPILAPIGNKLAKASNLLAFTATATDPEAPPETLTYSLKAGAPAGASINVSTGVFTWTPKGTQTGNKIITVYVTDNGNPPLNDSETITITVSDWSDTFDTYSLAQRLDGTADDGGWKGWDNNPAAGGTISSNYAHSTSFSNMVTSQNDNVHQYTGYTSGKWVYTAWQYIPLDFSGKTYFNLMSTYVDGGAKKWALEIGFDSVSNKVKPYQFGNGSMDLIKGQWVELRTVVNISTHTWWFYYNGQLLCNYTNTSIITGIAAVDLWADGATNVYYDDMSLRPGRILTTNIIGNGTITKNPNYMAYNNGEVVSLTATPVMVYIFSGWSGTVPAGHQNDNPLSITMNANKNITATFTIQGTQNTPPVLASIGNKSAKASNLLTFTATATDLEVPPQILTYSLSNGAPTGATINANTGVFTWTPKGTQTGTSTITVRATDNGNPPLNDSETITITVSDWSDTFDTYTLAQRLDGTADDGGWKGWDNNHSAGGTVSGNYTHTAPYTDMITGQNDNVHQYYGYTTGNWVYTAWQYIPTNYSGKTYFMLLSTYSDNGTKKYAMEILFNSVTNKVKPYAYGSGSLPLIKGQWVELRTQLNLTSQTWSFYYNGQLLSTYTGINVNGIAAVDLWANGASNVYYDDMSLIPS